MKRQNVCDAIGRTIDLNGIPPSGFAGDPPSVGEELILLAVLANRARQAFFDGEVVEVSLYNLLVMSSIGVRAMTNHGIVETPK